MPLIIGKQRTTHEVWLCDPYGRRLALVDNVVGFDIVRVANAISYCSVTLPGNFHEEFNIAASVDWVVEFWRSPEQGGNSQEATFFVREIAYEEDQGGSDLLVLAGPDATELLDRRIVAYAAGSSQSEKTDYADDMMKDIVRENLGSAATDSDRDLSDFGFTVAADTGSGPSITKGFAWQKVLKVLQDISRISEENGTRLFFSVVPVVSGPDINFEFRTYINQPGQDRTYDSGDPIIFSKEWGNLKDPRLHFDYLGESNYVYGGGQGEGSDRYITEQSDDVRVGSSIWNRREAFADARSEATQAAVQSRAKEVLRGGSPRVRFTGTLLDTPQARYGVDWFFGDRIVVSYRGLQFNGTVRAIRLSLGGDGKERVDAKVEVEV
jgi:hypothetical protein